METPRLLNKLSLSLSFSKWREKSIGGDHDEKSWPESGLNPRHSGDSQAPYRLNHEVILIRVTILLALVHLALLRS
jgi:hypothetical protein